MTTNDKEQRPESPRPDTRSRCRWRNAGGGVNERCALPEGHHEACRFVDDSGRAEMPNAGAEPDKFVSVDREILCWLLKQIVLDGTPVAAVRLAKKMLDSATHRTGEADR